MYVRILNGTFRGYIGRVVGQSGNRIEVEIDGVFAWYRSRDLVRIK